MARAPTAALLAGVLLLGACGQRVEIRTAPAPVAAVSELQGPIVVDDSPGATGDPGERSGRRGRRGAGNPEPPAPPVPGAPLPGEESSLPEVPPSAQRVAVVIGIDDYPGDGNDLNAAVADARLVYGALSSRGFGRTVLLLDGEATAAAIREAIGWLGREVGPGTVGVLFYAGHVRQVDGDRDGDGESRDEALVGSDGRLVFDGEVARALAPARGRLWLAWATCFAEGFNDAAGPNRISTYASAEDALAYESRSLGHSFMVEYMVRRGLVEAGKRSVEGMHDLASKQMRGRYERYRPLQDDRVPGRLVLGGEKGTQGAGQEPDKEGERPGKKEEPGTCFVVLRCRS